jgi:methylase of polypeptide subunit release factors
MPGSRCHDLQAGLDAPDPSDGLPRLFRDVLNWGGLSGPPQPLAVPGIAAPLTLAPVAQVGGLPVLRVDWPGDRPPTLGQRRAVSQALAPWHREHLLCYSAAGGRHKAFVWARQRDGRPAELRTLPYEVASPARTTVERLGKLAFRHDDLAGGESAAGWVTARLDDAFSVEALTRDFFRDYRQVFGEVERQVSGVPAGEPPRLHTQRLFNRLMFVFFLQKKGWLSVDGDRNYLRALFEAARGEDFLNDRLYWAFGHGLDRSLDSDRYPETELRGRRGVVPFLGGGLFREDDHDGRGKVRVPREAFALILDLFERYHFTVTESTPLDIEVAVDPEMLGKVFEELVTDRYEQGAYYTPRVIVAYMCREALKCYLARVVADRAAVARFVDRGDGSGLADPAAVLRALQEVTVCDPACGSGAYLLGMMHELLDLQQVLHAAHGVGTASVYERKLDIVRTNLYGVDKHQVAVTIARLRLWLSLVIDYEGDDPPPLPNLESKIQAGDSLLKDEGGGFDVVVANPPYLRSRLVEKAYKKVLLRSGYGDVYHGRADLCVYFYARAQQLLRPGGAACFISSNKWLRADYGERLRRQLLDRQAFHLIVDFGELPVFTANTFPAIFLWQKQDRGGASTRWLAVKDLKACYDEGIREHVERLGETLPAAQFTEGGDRVLSAAAAARRAVMRRSGKTLGQVLKGRICYGIKTGLNRAFVVDRATRDRLAADGTSGAILKPLLVGDHVRRYEVHFRERYLIFARQGIDIERYPAVRAHLEQFREDLTAKLKDAPQAARGRKPGKYCWYELQDCVEYHDLFEGPKILYAIIGKQPRFVLDTHKLYANDKTFLLPGADWYLLGVLNSRPAFEYLRGTCSVLGDEEKGGRLEFRKVHLQTLPIPDAGPAERAAVARLARLAQKLHRARRRRVEQFLRDAGTSPAAFRKLSLLEQPWRLTPEEFVRRVERPDLVVFAAARRETRTLTRKIDRVEAAIDRRVAALYGLP